MIFGILYAHLSYLEVVLRKIILNKTECNYANGKNISFRDKNALNDSLRPA